MKFDDLLTDYLNESGKDNAYNAIKKPLIVACVLMCASTFASIFIHCYCLAILLVTVAIIIIIYIGIKVKNTDRKIIEDKQYERIESILIKHDIYDINKPRDFKCFDILIQDAEKMLPRYKFIDSGEIIGVFSTFASALLCLILGFINPSKLITSNHFQNICIMLMLIFFVVAISGMSISFIFRDCVNRRYYDIEKFISDLSDFKLRAIIRLNNDSNKEKNSHKKNHNINI